MFPLRRILFCSFLAGTLLLDLPFLQAWPGGHIHRQDPDYLTFDELKKLSENPKPGGALGAKLKRFWKTPIISNEAYDRGVRRPEVISPILGPIISVGTWNIEKSYYTSGAVTLLKSAEGLDRMLDLEKTPKGSWRYDYVHRQRARLAAADILILQEMDIGHKRSGYVNAAEKIANALDMNYTYAAQQLEIDPVYLGTEKILKTNGLPDEEATHKFETDPARYKGVFGSAVLSRFPIKRVEVFQLKNQPYDWYEGEKQHPAFMEKTRRLGTKAVFKNVMTREMKVGGRVYFRTDLEVPGLPNNTLTVINIHLEIKCQPEGRVEQLWEILSYIQKIKNPVIMAGDFNAAPNDISPTSAKRIITRTASNPATWVNAAVTFLTPYGPLNAVRGVTNEAFNLQDPFKNNIGIIAPNPVKPLFQMVENFKFDDGTAFDFRGDKDRSTHAKTKKLANSNERDFKGFKTTFQVKRPLGPVIGKLRLDWMFVKSFSKSTEDPSAPYKLAPHFGETLEEMNTSLISQISDHHPNIVDLPLEEPELKKLKEMKEEKEVEEETEES